EQPFRATSKAGLMVAILHDHPAAPLGRCPAIPALLDRAVLRCPAKAPDDRWQSAADLAAELTYILDSPAVVPAPRTVTHRRPRVPMVAAGLAALAAAGFGLVTMTGPPSSPTYERLTYR